MSTSTEPLSKYNNLLSARIAKGSTIRNYWNRMTRRRENAKREKKILNAFKYKYPTQYNANLINTMKRAKNTGYKSVSLVNKETNERMKNFLNAQAQAQTQVPIKKSTMNRFRSMFSKKNKIPTQKEQINYAIKKTINNASLENQLYWAQRIYNKRPGYQKLYNRAKKAVGTYLQTRRNKKLAKQQQRQMLQNAENAKHRAMVQKPLVIRNPTTTPPPTAPSALAVSNPTNP